MLTQKQTNYRALASLRARRARWIAPYWKGMFAHSMKQWIKGLGAGLERLTHTAKRKEVCAPALICKLISLCNSILKLCIWLVRHLFNVNESLCTWMIFRWFRTHYCGPGVHLSCFAFVLMKLCLYIIIISLCNTRFVGVPLVKLYSRTYSRQVWMIYNRWKHLRVMPKHGCWQPASQCFSRSSKS